MKKYLLIILIVLELSLVKIPSYVELNNLAIIEEIAIEEKNNHYTIILKEIIPIKADQGIDYEYKYYKSSSTSLEKAYTKLTTQTKKKLYLNKVKSLITNTPTSKEITTTLKIYPSNIVHTKDIYKEINYPSNQS